MKGPEEIYVMWRTHEQSQRILYTFIPPSFKEKEKKERGIKRSFVTKKKSRELEEREKMKGWELFRAAAEI